MFRILHRRYLLWLPALLLASVTAFAHVGSPDVYFDGQAGPYRLLVTVRPPAMIPGLAQIEVRSDSPNVRALKVVPLHMVGEGSKYPPAGDELQPSKDDPQFFSGQLWIMGSGSWQVRVEVDGTQGSGMVAVPVPAFATRTLTMQKTLGWFLFAVMALLVAAFVSIMGAGSREGFLDPGQKPGRGQMLRGAIAMGVAALLLTGILFLGNGWWSAEASDRATRVIYKPPPVEVTLPAPGQLRLRIGPTNWLARNGRTNEVSLISDHGHLMHLFLVRVPQMDRFYHLHPDSAGNNVFSQQLPAMPAGHYQIFADTVRTSGFPDTMTAEIDLPDLQGGATGATPNADDSQAIGPALPGSLQSTNTATLPDGGRMIWERDSAPIRAGRAMWFRFRVEDQQGKPAQDMEPYMGMAGHAEFVSFDRTVFAHIHPEGSVAMAALALANPPPKSDAMAGMGHTSSEVSFPYGFPKAGDYRLFVQVKRAGKVETGIFDVKVEP
jgi:hypothetical protein